MAEPKKDQKKVVEDKMTEVKTPISTRNLIPGGRAFTAKDREEFIKKLKKEKELEE